MKILAAMLVLLPVTLLAQDDEEEVEGPVAKVEAPEEVDPGEILEISAKQSKGDHFTWQVYHHGGTQADIQRQQRIQEMIEYLKNKEYTIIAPKGTPATDYRIYDEGKTLILPSYEGRNYVVFFSVSNENGIASAIVQPKVKGQIPPDPPPDPDPGPDPPPVPPVNPFSDLTEKVKGWAANYPVDQKKAVSQIFLTEAARGHTTVEALSNATSSGMQSALGNNYPSWLTFRISMAQELTTLKNIGRLSDMNTHNQAWQAIAKGLE